MQRYGYIYQADVYCGHCGDAICGSLTAQGKAPLDSMDQSSYDSDDYPKSADVECESDTPQYCGGCEVFLSNSLTSSGYAYVKDALDETDAVKVSQLSEVLQEWAGWYNFRYWDAEDCSDGLDTTRKPGWYSDESY